MAWGGRAFAWALIFGGMYLSSRHSFHLFHSLAELFSIVVACGIFMVAWNSRDFGQNRFLLFLGVAYLNVAAVDLLHLLTYKGMGVFPGLGPDPPIQFWIAARYLEALSLVAAPLVSRWRIKPGALFWAYLLINTLLITSVFGGQFPSCFVPGQGVTAFKSASEYLVSTLLVVAIMLIRADRAMDKGIQRLMIWACALTIAAELSFSSYTTLFGLFNQLGHYLKILSFYLIYKATIQASLTRPYQVLFHELNQRKEELTASEMRLNTLLNNAAAAVVFLDPDFRVREFNPGARRLWKWRRQEVLGEPFLELMVPSAQRGHTSGLLAGVLQGQDLSGAESAMLTKDGVERIILWNSARLNDHDGQPLGVIISGLDITERNRIAREREKLIQELESALAEIRTLSGLLPICANCKKIRDDQGYWRQLEAFLQEHSQARFSHGICPECARQLYPDLNLPLDRDGS